MQIAGIIGGARKIVRILARVKAGEKVLIAADTDTAVVAEALATAALEITPEVVITMMTPVAVDGDEPPAIVAAALQAADVALIPVSYSISHSTAVRSAIKHGTRVLALPAATPDQLVRGGAEADFEAASPTVRKMGELLTAASKAHLTTPAGTNCTFDLTGRSGNAHDCILDRQGSSRRFPTSRPTSRPWTGRSRG